MTRYVLHHSAVIAPGAYGVYELRASSWPEARVWLHAGPIESRIGYAEIAGLIARHTGVRLDLSRENAAMEPGDEALIVRLRCRVAQPGTTGSATEAGPKDWEVALLRRLS